MIRRDVMGELERLHPEEFHSRRRLKDECPCECHSPLPIDSKLPICDCVCGSADKLRHEQQRVQYLEGMQVIVQRAGRGYRGAELVIASSPTPGELGDSQGSPGDDNKGQPIPVHHAPGPIEAAYRQVMADAPHDPRFYRPPAGPVPRMDPTRHDHLFAATVVAAIFAGMTFCALIALAIEWLNR